MNEKSLNASVLLVACTNIVLYNAVICKNILTHSCAIAQVVTLNTILLHVRFVVEELALQ
jgi:hypothetical protein